VNQVNAQTEKQTNDQSPPKIELPSAFLEYINKKIEANGSGGRPHLLAVLKKQGKDAKEVLLDILEDAWLKGRPCSRIAHDYNVSNDTMWRVLKDLEPFKESIKQILLLTPRAKKWFVEELETSDYETVQNYIKRAKREGLKNWKSSLKNARRFWTWTKYKAPENWTADNVHDFLVTLTGGAQSGMLDAIRKIAPQIRDDTSSQYVGVGMFRAKIQTLKKDLFGAEVKMAVDALKKHGLKHEATVIKLHIQIGAREGAHDSSAGMTGLRWSYFKNDFHTVDDFETKVHGGIWWRNCPLDIFFPELPDELRALWIKRGRPTDDKVLAGGYDELNKIYAMLRKLLKDEYEGKIDPSLMKEFSTIRCHDADKLHVNMLWEAGVPLEVVAGQFLGKNEGVGLMGRGWLAIDVIKKHYLSLTQRSHRFQRIQQNVRDYAQKVLVEGGTYDVKESEMRA
jgi:hypothetical protein